MALAFGDILFSQNKDGTIEVKVNNYKQCLTGEDIKELYNWLNTLSSYGIQVRPNPPGLLPYPQVAMGAEVGQPRRGNN